MNNEKQKIKLVVFNEHTLGYILPELSNQVQVLHQSVLKGAPFKVLPDFELIGDNDKVRMASEKDFGEYRVSFEGFNSEEYEFVRIK